MFTEDTLSPTKCIGKKFFRRRDLTSEKRLHIAFMALHGVWGAVSELARDFMISRRFVYMLRDDLQEITEQVFGERSSFERGKEWIRKKAIAVALCLRLEGRCSILSTSQILKRFGSGRYNSVGWVSGILQFAGASLPNTLVDEENGTQLVIMACDEIFSHLRPILITVEPVSSAILRIELADSREVSVWKEHWECIERSGYLAVYLVNDEGKSMSVAQKQVLRQVIRQSDTFHGLAHRLGAWVDRLEKTAYTAIEREAVIEKKTKEYETAKEQAEKAIDSYEHFHYLYLYLCLIGTLQVFDRHGNPNERNAGEATVYAALDLMGELNNGSIDKEVKTIRRLVPELFSYLDEAARIVGELKSYSGIPEEALRALCIAW